MIKQSDIVRAFHEVRAEFPFPGYMDHNLDKYIVIISQIVKECPPRSKVLSIGSGPCDLESMLSNLGYEVTAIDDLKDHWHLIGTNRERIKDFAKRMSIEFIMESAEIPELEANHFDIVLLIDVIEHLHTSPRELLNFSISALKVGGLLLVETPNSAALAKRLWVLLGKSNQTDANFFYWNIGEYRSHVREYSPSEVKQILQHHKLDILSLKMLNYFGDIESKRIFKKIIVKAYAFVSRIYPNFKSTILLGGRKPADWQPTDASIRNFSKYYRHIERWNLDNIRAPVLLDSIVKEHGRR